MFLRFNACFENKNSFLLFKAKMKLLVCKPYYKMIFNLIKL